MCRWRALEVSGAEHAAELGLHGVTEVEHVTGLSAGRCLGIGHGFVLDVWQRVSHDELAAVVERVGIEDELVRV
jgi:hypothetical protein